MADIPKVQWNVAASKAKWYATTDQLQVADEAIVPVPPPCEHCTSDQPTTINVTPSAFTETCCDHTIGAATRSFTASGFVAAINGNTYAATFLGGYGNYCSYEGIHTGSLGDYILYAGTTDCSSGCTAFYTNWYITYPIGSVKFALTLTAAGVDIEITVDILGNTGVQCNSDPSWHDPFTLPVFSGSITYTGADECGDTANTASNDLTTCWDGVSQTILSICANSGSVAISIP